MRLLPLKKEQLFLLLLESLDAAPTAVMMDQKCDGDKASDGVAANYEQSTIMPTIKKEP